jgi:hypothetical protein
MTIRINNEGLAVPVSQVLVEYLSGLLDDNETDDYITFNFKDPNYISTSGYFPVEVRIEPIQTDNGKWKLCYITDFHLVGKGIFEKLVADVDFNFELNQYNSMNDSYALAEADEYFPMWEADFIKYAKERDVFI